MGTPPSTLERADHLSEERPGLGQTNLQYALLGEFGWLAAVTMLALGLPAGRWHVSHPAKTEAEVA